jgi:hypothetical protein
LGLKEERRRGMKKTIEDGPAACGSHHRQMVDDLLGPLKLHFAA